MGTEDALTSSTLARLLAFLLVACGGRYSTTSNDQEGGGANRSGGTNVTPPNDPPSGGITEPSIPPGTGGTSTGTGGAVAAGFGPGIGGTGFAFGGTVAAAGSSIGTGGANPGMPVSNAVLCSAYCQGSVSACPERFDAAVCTKECQEDLSIASFACVGTRRESYRCIADAMRGAGSCGTALALASKLCGSDAGEPVPCDPAICDEGFYGDGNGCHRTLSCGPDHSVELFCREGQQLCTCLIGGMQVADFKHPHDYAKAACLDDTLMDSCMAYLP